MFKVLINPLITCLLSANKDRKYMKNTSPPRNPQPLQYTIKHYHSTGQHIYQHAFSTY